jgi:hypothetical protein
MSKSSWYSVVIDAHDLHALASFWRPGSMPSSCAVSDSSSSIVIVSVSPLVLVTTQRSGSSTRVFGATIQFSGLYAPPSLWIEMQPSALMSSRRVAIGRCAESRPW